MSIRKIKKNWNRYFHISHIYNEHKIFRQGIIANKYGEIFIVAVYGASDEEVIELTRLMCKNQLAYSKYCVVEIDPKGITGKLYPDDVKEGTAQNQRVLKQQTILLEHLKLFGKYNIEGTITEIKGKKMLIEDVEKRFQGKTRREMRHAPVILDESKGYYISK